MIKAMVEKVVHQGRGATAYIDDARVGLGVDRTDDFKRARGMRLKPAHRVGRFVLVVGGRAAASIYAVADWLAGNSVKAKKSKPPPSSAVSIPEPKRKRASLGKYLLALQVQQGFLAELHSAIQSNLGSVGEAPFTGFGDDENDTTFDDYVEAFFVDSDGLVISRARDEENATIVSRSTPPSATIQWMTWDTRGCRAAPTRR